jgi:hypothetical protein
MRQRIAIGGELRSEKFSVIQTCDIARSPLFPVFFNSGEYNSEQDISGQPYWILRGEECVELNLHSTHLHIHGVVLKLRINLEFLNFNMTQERLLQKGKKKTFSRKFAKL